jgi:hypothetical protein
MKNSNDAKLCFKSKFSILQYQKIKMHPHGTNLILINNFIIQ